MTALVVLLYNEKNKNMVIKKGKTNWIHLTDPSEKELVALKKEFGFHPVIMAELEVPSARSKVEIYNNYMYIVYHLPIFDIKERVSRKSEIDFLITKNTVVSISYENLEPIEVITEKIENNADYKDKILGGDSSRLLYHIIESCIIFSLRQLRHIDEKVEDIRMNMFSNDEKNLLEKISYVKRDILSYHLITKSQMNIFNSLNKVGPDFFGEKSKVYFADLEGDFLKAMQLCENYKETAEAFEKTNSQLLTIRMTKVMQRFSVLAFITFPIMVFLALFTLETSSRPIIGKTPYDFWIMAAVVVIAIGIMIGIFRKKEWL